MVTLLFALAAVIRGLILARFDIFPLFSSHFWVIGADLIFFVAVLYWMIARSKVKLGLATTAYLLSFFGSLIWDFQDVFIPLKIFLPFIFILIIHRDKFEKVSFKSFAEFLTFLILYPLSLIEAVWNSFQNKVKSKNEGEINYMGPVMIGLVVGVGILGLLLVLDPEFADFLQIEKIKEILVNSVVSLLYYFATFVWFFFGPMRTKFEYQESSPHVLKSVVHRATVLVTAIAVGYTFYDLFIIGRILNVLSLTFDSVGKNTQLYFIELIVLAGVLLFAVAYILDALADFKNSASALVTRVTTFGAGSLLWLLPPVANILRALLVVYIPAFGLTHKRVFGIYTVIAFVAAFLLVVSIFGKDRNRLFINSIITFFLTLTVLGFVMPNNIMIANWHMDAYLSGKEVDLQYFGQIKLEKWGHLFFEKLEPRKNKTDNLWGFFLARSVHDKDREEGYLDGLTDWVEGESSEIERLLRNQEIGLLMDKYKGEDYWYYKGGKIDGVNVLANTGEVGDQLKDHLTTSNWYDGYFFDRGSFAWFDVSYNSPYASQQFSVSLDLDFGKYRGNPNILKIKSEVAPFWVRDLKESCSASFGQYSESAKFYNYCANYRSLYAARFNYPEIPEDLVRAYFTSQTSPVFNQ